MATPGELTRILAAALGIPEATVAIYDRHLRTAGLRSKRGRGIGAAQVTARDAAHLLTAILGSGAIKEAVATVERYAATRPRVQAPGDAPFCASGVAALIALPRDHSFVDAVEAIIAAAAAGELANVIATAPVAGADPESAVPLIDIAALTPGTAGDIRLAGLPDGTSVSVRYARPSPWDGRGQTQPSEAELAEWEAAMKARRGATDLEQYRRISGRTVMRVAAALGRKEEKA